MPRYNPTPAEDYYTPEEDLVLDEVMDVVLVRYGKDPRRLRAVLNKLATVWPRSFRRVIWRRTGRRVLL